MQARPVTVVRVPDGPSFRAPMSNPAAVLSCGVIVADHVTQEALAPVFAAARKAGAKTVLDVVTPGPGDYLSRLDRILPLTDVFLPNDHEGMLMTGEGDPLKQAEVFRRLGAGTVVITC